MLFEHQPTGAAASGTAGRFTALLAAAGYRLFDVDGTGPFDADTFVDGSRPGRVWNFVARDTRADRRAHGRQQRPRDVFPRPACHRGARAVPVEVVGNGLNRVGELRRIFGRYEQTVHPSATTSGNPPTSVATTGRPAANASGTTPDWVALRGTARAVCDARRASA